MTKIITTFLTATAFFFVFGCKDNKQEVQAKDTESNDEETKGTPGSGKNLVILCDVSSSIDSALLSDKGKKSQIFNKMKSLCKSILRANEPNTNFYFYFVSQNSTSSPFFTFKSEPWSKNTKQRVRKNFHVADSLIAYRIDSAFLHNEKYTCLLTSIEHCFLVFKSLNAQDHAEASEFIILSDMIEECEESPVGKIMMNTKPGKPFLSPEQTTKLDKYKNTSVNFDNELIKVKILFNTSGIDDIPKKAIMQRWKTIFAKYGYKAAAIDSTAPFIEVPDFKKNKLYELF